MATKVSVKVNKNLSSAQNLDSRSARIRQSLSTNRQAIRQSGNQAIGSSDGENPDSPTARQPVSPSASVIDLRSHVSAAAPPAREPEERQVANGQDDRQSLSSNRQSLSSNRQSLSSNRQSLRSSSREDSTAGLRGYADLEHVSPGRDVPTQEVSGILDIAGEGHGFLRPKFRPSDEDVYISASQIRKFMLRPGDDVVGLGRPPKDNERYFGLLKVVKVNDLPAENNEKRPKFEALTPIYPNEKIKLEIGKVPLSNRVIDIIAPIGKGQRGMVVSPPKAGKTTILKDIARGISENFPKIHLMAALIGERPEEVTDISRSVKGEVIASNFDEPAEYQTRVAEITLERAKRLVEKGVDVVILLDSITRLARAYNLSVPPSGRTLTGGFDPAALYPPKRFFGAARNCEEGGSLTIIGTALIDTGSRMDDLIYEEFKGTGNMELHLDRKLAERRIYPSIDVERSSTRQEQLLFSDDDYKKIVTMRRMLSVLNGDERTEILIERLNKTASNQEFLDSLAKEVK